jgi:hypothetical protein
MGPEPDAAGASEPETVQRRALSPRRGRAASRARAQGGGWRTSGVTIAAGGPRCLGGVASVSTRLLLNVPLCTGAAAALCTGLRRWQWLTGAVCNGGRLHRRPHYCCTSSAPDALARLRPGVTLTTVLDSPQLCTGCWTRRREARDVGEWLGRHSREPPLSSCSNAASGTRGQTTRLLKLAFWAGWLMTKNSGNGDPPTPAPITRSRAPPPLPPLCAQRTLQALDSRSRVHGHCCSHC